MHPLLERAALRLDPGPAVPHGVRDVDGPAALGCEWLEADGLGGFASGTALGIRTRRYHGALLVAAPTPADRFLLVQGTEAWVETAAGTFALSTNLYHNLYEGDVVYPEGIAHLREFAAEPWPRWRFDLPDGTRIVAELYVPRGTSAVVCTWSREFGHGPATLRVRPCTPPTARCRSTPSSAIATSRGRRTPGCPRSRRRAPGSTRRRRCGSTAWSTSRSANAACPSARTCSRPGRSRSTWRPSARCC
jgi:hypothetical protein